MADRTHDSHLRNMLPVMDEFSRESLANSAMISGRRSILRIELVFAVQTFVLADHVLIYHSANLPPRASSDNSTDNGS